mmetsp:Transcript_23780/g.67314  ORF Transcript_23780/g.67314 Transcript_23780/m.67314 type:complete len:464 (+) Transcript_23780:373-1764(+)
MLSMLPLLPGTLPAAMPTVAPALQPAAALQSLAAPEVSGGAASTEGGAAATATHGCASMRKSRSKACSSSSSSPRLRSPPPPRPRPPPRPWPRPLSTEASAEGRGRGAGPRREACSRRTSSCHSRSPSSANSSAPSHGSPPKHQAGGHAGSRLRAPLPASAGGGAAAPSGAGGEGSRLAAAVGAPWLITTRVLREPAAGATEEGPAGPCPRPDGCPPGRRPARPAPAALRAHRPSAPHASSAPRWSRGGLRGWPGGLSHAAEGNSRFRSKGAKFQKMMWKPSDGPQVEGRLIVRLLTGADSLRFGVASMTPEGGRAGAHLVILSLENIKAVPSGPRKGSATALHTIVEDAANEDVATEDPDATDSVGESTGDGSFTEYKAWGVNSPPVSPGVATEFAMEPFALLDWNWAQSPSTSSLDSTDGLAPPPQRLRTRRRTAPVLPPRLRSIVRPTGLEVRKRIVMSL